MTGREALDTLLARIANSLDGTVHVTEEELSRWPRRAVATLKANGLLRPASPATSVTCDGCERRCQMPVEVLDYSGARAAFVFCDRRDDIDRVEVPLERLNRWQSGGRDFAEFLGARLNANRAAGIRTEGRQWAVGLVRGQKKAAPVVLSIVDLLVLELAGHSVPLAEVLSLTLQGATLLRDPLEECIDNPKPGGLGHEPKVQRRKRLTADIAAEMAKGTTNPTTTVAAREGISRQMLHKIVRQPKEPT